MKILLAGDNFVRTDILAESLATRLSTPPSLTSLTLPWPQVPFGPVAEVEEASGGEAQIAEAAADAEVVITQMAPLTEWVLDRIPKLRLIVCSRGGPVNINLAAAAERGIAVSSTPGRNAVAAAEYTLVLMLAAMRRLPEAHTALAEGHWRGDMYDYDQCGSEIAGSLIGVVGLGAVGGRVAELVRAIGGTVLVHDPFATAEAVGAGIELVTFDDLLCRSEVITLHARLTAETKHMIGEAEFERMRKGAVLVNTGRGGLLDYDAAAAALEKGKLAALGLDVFGEEPVPPDTPLLKMPGVVLSPHLAGATRQTAQRAAAIAAAEVDRYTRNQPLAYVVNGVNREGIYG